MTSLDAVRDEIRELEREIQELEELQQLNTSDEDVIEISDNEDNDEGINNDELFANIGQMDQLLYDILNGETTIEDKGEIIDGKRVIKSKELQEFHDVQIPKIQIENVYRFNGITVFPISNDSTGDFIGLRFDVFNSYLRKFSTCHYIILKQFEMENNGKVVENVSTEWRWEVFQTTVPKYIPVGDIANVYLTTLHTRDTDTPNAIPGFNRINKFAMRVYEHLIFLEDRRSFVLQLKQEYTNVPNVHIKADLAVSRIDIVVSQTGLQVDTATHVISEKGHGGALEFPDLDAVFAALKMKIEILLH